MTGEGSASSTGRTDAYCPSCEVELKPTEYSDENGHEKCEIQDLWLSQEAFLRIVDTGKERGFDE